MVYNSWLAMQQAGETDEETCAYNDLALVKLDPSDVGKINPSIPDFGGPTGVGQSGPGKQVYTYGNSSLRAGITLLSPKNGLVVQKSPAAGATRSTRSRRASRATRAPRSSTRAARRSAC